MTDDNLSASAAQPAAKAQNNPFDKDGQKDTKTERSVIGKRIVAVRRLTPQEMEAEGWECEREGATALVLDDGSLIYPSRDDEGNGAGTLFGSKGGDSFYIFAGKEKAAHSFKVAKKKPVYIKDEGDFASVRQGGKQIGILAPNTAQLNSFTDFLKKEGIEYESEYE